MQSKTWSVIESLTNIVVGITLSFLLQAFLLWKANLQFTWGMVAEMSGWFTVLSFIRSYALRRFFNSIDQQAVVNRVDAIITKIKGVWK